MNPYAIIAALVASIVISAGSYYAGWSQRGDHEAAIALKAKLVADANLKKAQDRADVLAVDLEAEKRNIKTVTIEVIKEIPKYTNVYIERGQDVTIEPPKPIVPAVYTFGAVRLFNRALRPDLPASASEFAYPAGVTDITRADIDTKDILAVHAINAGRYAECRTQLNKLIDFELGKPAQ